MSFPYSLAVSRREQMASYVPENNCTASALYVHFVPLYFVHWIQSGLALTTLCLCMANLPLPRWCRRQKSTATIGIVIRVKTANNNNVSLGPSSHSQTAMPCGAKKGQDMNFHVNVKVGTWRGIFAELAQLILIPHLILIDFVGRCPPLLCSPFGGHVWHAFWLCGQFVYHPLFIPSFWGESLLIWHKMFLFGIIFRCFSICPASRTRMVVFIPSARGSACCYASLPTLLVSF
jgi:hypothetical protein